MKLTILFGGASFEHEISIVSAISLKEKLSGFDLSFIFCDQDHSFYLIDPSAMKAVTFSKGEHKKMPKLCLENGGFVKRGLFSSSYHKNVVLNLIHGADGEDGTISSLLDFYSINYIGPRTDASVFSYDKRYTKYLCKARDIKTFDYTVLSSTEQNHINMEYPIIIKPSKLGSSIGVSIVRDENELDYALDVAFEFDKNVVIEPFVDNVKEYNLAGFYADGKINFSIIEEPKKGEFLDFEKKYMDFSRTQEAYKADISQELELKLKSTFEKVYKDLFLGALIRCDFFVIDGEVYLNEINPIPGSMANYLFSDFKSSIELLSSALPHYKRPKVSYEYIHSINSAKGK